MTLVVGRLALFVIAWVVMRFWVNGPDHIIWTTIEVAAAVWFGWWFSRRMTRNT